MKDVNKMDKLIEAIKTLQENCEHSNCDTCVFNRAEDEGCYDCMLLNESACFWDENIVYKFNREK